MQRMISCLLRPILAMLLLAAGPASHAHDTWFHTVPGAAGRLELGTGNQFPRQETGIAEEFLAAQGCDAPPSSGGRRAMKPLGNSDTALLLAVPPGAQSCWVQLTPFEVTIAPDKIELYLKEIQASPEQRAIWAEMQRKGLPWTERYTKHARVELGPAGAADVSAEATSTLGMDLRLIPGDGPLRVGSTLNAVVLRDGAPLAGQAIELRSALSPLGIWRRSDAQGRISVRVPLPGAWVLRGVDLRLSDRVADQWESRFVTLAFDVAPAPRP